MPEGNSPFELLSAPVSRPRLRVHHLTLGLCVHQAARPGSTNCGSHGARFILELHGRHSGGTYG